MSAPEERIPGESTSDRHERIRKAYSKSGVMPHFQKGDKVRHKDDNEIYTVFNQQDHNLFGFERFSIGEVFDVELHERHGLPDLKPGDHFLLNHKTADPHTNFRAKPEVNTVAYQIGEEVYMIGSEGTSYCHRYDCLPYNGKPRQKPSVALLDNKKGDFYIFIGDCPAYRAPTFYWALKFADAMARPNELKIIRGTITDKAFLEELEQTHHNLRNYMY